MYYYEKFKASIKRNREESKFRVGLGQQNYIYLAEDQKK